MTLTVVTAFTKNSKSDPATGLTLADIGMYLYAVNRSTGAVTEIWNGAQHPDAEIPNMGEYVRMYALDDMDTYHYLSGAKYNGVQTLDADWVTGTASQDNAGIWGYATRTLTMTGAAIVAAVSGAEITVQRGDTLTAAIAGLGDITARSKLWFTVKRERSEADTAALIQIEESAGLVRLNGADASERAANGSITVDDEIDGDVTIELDEAETDDLAPKGALVWDIQMKTTGGDVRTLAAGAASVSADVTRAVA